MEISKHFMEAGKRLCVTTGLTEQDRDRQIATAFARILKRLEKDPETYFEDVEEVLYYIGKFPVESEELVDRLLHVIKEPERYHRVYTRTAYLALAQCRGMSTSSSMFCVLSAATVQTTAIMKLTGGYRVRTTE